MNDEWGEDFPPSGFSDEDFFNDAASFNFPDIDEAAFGAFEFDDTDRAWAETSTSGIEDELDIDFFGDTPTWEDWRESVGVPVDTGTNDEHITDDDDDDDDDEQEGVDFAYVGYFRVPITEWQDNYSGSSMDIRGPYPDLQELIDYFDRNEIEWLLTEIYYDESTGDWYAEVYY